MLTQARGAGAVVAAARTDRGMTPEDLVREVLMHPALGPRFALSAATVRNVENGKYRNPRVRVKFAIATVLDKHVSDLWPVSA